MQDLEVGANVGQRSRRALALPPRLHRDSGGRVSARVRRDQFPKQSPLPCVEALQLRLLEHEVVGRAGARYQWSWLWSGSALRRQAFTPVCGPPVGRSSVCRCSLWLYGALWCALPRTGDFSTDGKVFTRRVRRRAANSSGRNESPIARPEAVARHRPVMAAKSHPSRRSTAAVGRDASRWEFEQGGRRHRSASAKELLVQISGRFHAILRQLLFDAVVGEQVAWVDAVIEFGVFDFFGREPELLHEEVHGPGIEFQ